MRFRNIQHCGTFSGVGFTYFCGASQVVRVEINWSANEGDKRNMGLITRSEGPLGRGNSNTLQYSCLEHLMDRGAWQAIVYGVMES